MMIALLAIGGMILVAAAMAYFMGYAQGLREQKAEDDKKRPSTDHRCSCGAVKMRLSGVNSRNANKIGLVTGNTYHQIPPFVCHPVHDAVLGND